MKFIKILSIGLCLSALSFGANAQQTTTQKMDNETSASGTASTTFEKKTKTKHYSSRKSPEGKRNGRGVSPSLDNSANGRGVKSTNTKAAVSANSPVRNSHSTGMRSNTTTTKREKTTTVKPRNTSATKQAKE